MRILILAVAMVIALVEYSTACETLPKWKARIKLGGKGPSVEVTATAKDKPTARKLIIAQYGEKTVFTSGPVKVRESAR